MKFRTGLLLVPVGCADPDFRDCSEEDVSLAAGLPDLLSETALLAGAEPGGVSSQALLFTPRFPLWTDGATKRRWLVLPDGGAVDTSDATSWGFPVGTEFFKEFERDGVRVETRLSRKTEEGWAAASYVWTAAGDDARLQLDALPDASGTPHDVPGAAECLACHGGRADFALGFSATQLDAETRQDLWDAGLLSAPVPGDLSLPDDVQAGLGYLHGNCSHCHNAQRDLQPQATDCYASGEDFDFTLPHTTNSVADAPAVRSARWQLGSPGDSEVLSRMSVRNTDAARPSMPPLGTEQTDTAGLAAVETLVAALPAAER